MERKEWRQLVMKQINEQINKKKDEVANKRDKLESSLSLQKDNSSKIRSTMKSMLTRNGSCLSISRSSSQQFANQSSTKSGAREKDSAAVDDAGHEYFSQMGFLHKTQKLHSKI